MSKSMNTVKGSSGKESQTDCLTELQPSAISEHSCLKVTPAQYRDWLTSLRPVFPVSRSASLASERVRTIPETCGPQQLSASVELNRDTHFWRMCQDFYPVDISDESLLTWPRAGMMCDGAVYQLPKWERRIGESASGFWPTPRANERQQQNSQDKHMALSKAVKLWPTPRCCSGKRSSGMNRTEFYRKMFPTPSAAAAIQGQNEADGKRGQTLVGAARGQTWPTPTNSMMTTGDLEQVRFAGSDPKRPDYKTANKSGGQLNPTWVEWLMGWPLGWTDLKPLATDKFQLWLRQHGV